MFSEELAVTHNIRGKSLNEEVYTVASRQLERDAIALETKLFLMQGGKIQHIPFGVCAIKETAQSMKEISQNIYKKKQQEMESH